MISEIVFKDIAEFKNVITYDGFPGIKKLSRINLFVGANNSGKSRMLRELFINSSIGFNYPEVDMSLINQAILRFHKQVNQLFAIGEDNTSRIPAAIVDIQMPFAASLANHLFLLGDLVPRIRNLRQIDFHSIPLSNVHNRDLLKHQFVPILADLIKEIPMNIQSLPYFKGEYLYLPMLRGLRPLVTDKGITDHYRTRTEKDYFENKLPDERKVFTGQSLYNDLTNLLLGDSVDREKVRAFENFISEVFYPNQVVNLIPKTKGDVVHVKIGKEERAIHELGDGIQSLIILFYPLFFNSNKQLLVFMEEPEHSLHPGFQRLFIETLHRKEFSECQFFITTHSNHFLDLTEEKSTEVSVFTFEKRERPDEEPSFFITNVSGKDDRSLELLGVRSSSVFLSNCTIWVEGITDRLYIGKLLNVYQDFLLKGDSRLSRYREDLHYSFVEYSGSNITHWSFDDEAELDRIKVLSITKKIFLVADSDDTEVNPETEKARRLKKLGVVLEGNFYKHKSIEMENTLHENVLLNSVALKERTSVNHIKPKKGIIQSDYSNKKIGTFVETKFQNLTKKYKGESGTILDKKGFCKIAITQIKTIDDFTEENKELCKRLIDFIRHSNHK